MNPFLPPEQKFAVLAVSNVRADFPDGLNLPDDVAVLRRFPIDLDPNWRNWLGLDLAHITDANLVFVCSSSDGSSLGALSISDSTNEKLANRLVEIFAMLRLLGTIEYESSFFLTGYSRDDRTFCQKYSKLARFHLTRGCLPWMLRSHDLTAAANLAIAKASFLSKFSDTHRSRIFRGWVALSSGLQQYYASDRIHAFVRALEALIYPEIAQTARQFVHRCSLFAAPNAQQGPVREALCEAYAMRCDVEHVNDWDRSLAGYAPVDRENVAYWRTRQMETLACLAYAQFFRDQELQKNFLADDHIGRFWRKPDHEIRAAFGQPCDITELKVVSSYDLAGRAKVSEWPAGWMDTLRRHHPM